MAVMFNVLQRGKWKNLNTPNITKQYTYRTTTPTDSSPRPFQQVTRQSSESSLVYTYQRAIDKTDFVCFGVNGVKQYDFYNYAYLPNDERSANKQLARTSYMVLDLISGNTYESFAKYELKNTSIRCELVFKSSKNYPFSEYGSKTTRDGGIFYSFPGKPCKIINCVWHAMSIADKDAIPTITCFNPITNTAKAGKIFTKSLGFTSSSSARDIYIYPNKVVDGSNTYYFDTNDTNAKVKFCYIVSQSTGGNGGCSDHWAEWHGWFIFGYWSYHWSSGAGGGAGGYSLELVKIPQDGYIRVNIPGTPGRAWNRRSQPRNGSVYIYHNDGTLLSEVVGGQAGVWGGNNNGTNSGGSGGYLNSTSTISSTNKYRINIFNAKGASGANSNRYKAGNAVGHKINAYISSDEDVTLPAITGRDWWWDSFDNANIPGAGAPSNFAQGGSCGPLRDGSNGEGPGAGGGGGAKAMFTDYIGGAGAGAFVGIGY